MPSSVVEASSVGVSEVPSQRAGALGVFGDGFDFNGVVGFLLHLLIPSAAVVPLSPLLMHWSSRWSLVVDRSWKYLRF